MVRPPVHPLTARRIPITFTKIQSVTTARQVIDQIVQAIRSGHYQVGDRLPSERQLAELLGISRPTLREAITTLATLGVLEIQTGVGTFVRSATIDENLAIRAAELLSTEESPLHALETRLLLEPGIAALAAERAEEQDLIYMRRALKEVAKRVARNEAFRATGMNFHMAVVRSIRNPVTEHACTIALALWFSNQPGWGEIVQSIVEQPGRLARYYANYERIYEAIKSGEAALAAQSMKDHLLEVQEDFLRY